ncbi:hypothetical protein GCM10023144_26840 [Pigmentiphaga soli]|uniref:DUF3613 domain-containing protein n=1 Tax=Pigmentiphaga soli TaxID=1007095 RepID=A0ABP8H5D9_9BURK
MKRPRHSSSFFSPASSHRLLAVVLALPALAAAQISAPLTGPIPQETPAQQRIPAVQAQQPAQPASPVVRQVPAPARTTAAAQPGAGAIRQAETADRAQPGAAVGAGPGERSATRTVPWTGSTANGALTRAVLRAQAEGRYAGPPLPTLGATAARSWSRYVDSFGHPIPEFYETTSQPSQ